MPSRASGNTVKRHLSKGAAGLLLLLAACGGSGKKENQVVPPEPVQTAPTLAPFEIVRDDYVFKIDPVADYEITARVLGTERYRTGWNALLSPVDFALAWGPMADVKLDDHISYSQGDRWYRYRCDREFPLDNGTIIAHTANVHILPSDDAIEDAALDIDKGDIVVLKGCLVDISGRAADGRTSWWHTSRTRSDSGDGSCEVFWVTSIREAD